MVSIKWMLKTFMLFIALSVCHAQESWIVHAAMGQEVVIPCGVQVKGPSKRLVWKLGDVNSPDNLAHSVREDVACDTRKKPNCFLWSDGSLELKNVQETDSGDYFCERDNDTFYSQHTLVVHPEVAFETCSSSEDVFVTQTGSDERLLAYTNPVCKNTNVIGIVICDPPSGAKIGMNFTEIVCTCTHSDNMVDTCEIPIPAVGIVCASVTAPGTLLGIFIGAFLVSVPLIVTALLKKKYSRKQRADEESHRLMDKTPNLEDSNSRTPQRSRAEHTKPEFTTSIQPNMTVIQGESLELKCSVSGFPIPTILWYKDGKQLDPQAGFIKTFSEGVAKLTAQSTKEGDEGMFSCVAVNHEGDDIISCNVVVQRSRVTLQLPDGNGTLADARSAVTDSGLPFTTPNESGNTAGHSPDGNINIDTPNMPSSKEIREVRVDDNSATFRILPSTTSPTEGLSICCLFGENLTVCFLGEDITTTRKANRLTVNEVTSPLHIGCLRSGKYCCSLKICAGEGNKDEREDKCKDSCEKEDSNETNHVAPNLNLHTGDTYSIRSQDYIRHAST